MGYFTEKDAHKQTNCQIANQTNVNQTEWCYPFWFQPSFGNAMAIVRNPNTYTAYRKTHDSFFPIWVFAESSMKFVRLYRYNSCSQFRFILISVLDWYNILYRTNIASVNPNGNKHYIVCNVTCTREIAVAICVCVCVCLFGECVSHIRDKAIKHENALVIVSWGESPSSIVTHTDYGLEKLATALALERNIHVQFHIYTDRARV